MISKPLIAYCIVKKEKPKIEFLNIYPDKDVRCNKNEEIIKIEILHKKSE